MSASKKTTLIYWISTILFLLPTAGSGIPEVFTDGPQAVVATMVHLGYPVYIMKILGVAKILGAIAILSNRSKRLKEWAYAGFVFDLLGATISHGFVQDWANAAFPFVVLILVLVSYRQWHRIEEQLPSN